MHIFSDGYMEKDVEQAIQKFDIISRGKSNSTNKQPFLHNNQVQNFHKDTDMITPIIVSIATANNNKIIKTEEKLSPAPVRKGQIDNNWLQVEDEVMENDNGFLSDDSLSPQSDYKTRCRAFAKYLGEELCLMDECTGDALITDMLKIIVEEKCKK